MNKYRVIVHGAKKKGMESSFGQFPSDSVARLWAISYGKKLFADYIELARKSNLCYNNYFTLDIIIL